MTDRAAAHVVALLTCHDRRELTITALRSWFGQQAPGVRLGAVLVDDGSADGTAAAVRDRFPDVAILPGDGTLYWAAGMALAERHARRLAPDAVLWLNDDVVLAPDALASLRRTSEQFRPAAVVAGALADPLTGQITYGAIAPSRWHPLHGSLVQPSGHAVRVGAVHGNVLYVPRQAYQRLGIDGTFQHAYADLDYGLRLQRIGYPAVLTGAVVGRCSRDTSSRGAPAARLPLRRRLRELNSPRGVPVRSHVRFLRRHGGPLWPVFVPVPYVKEVLRPASTATRVLVSLLRHHPGVTAHPARFLARLALWRIRTALGRDAIVRFDGYGVRFWCPAEWRGMSKLAFTLREDYEPELRQLRRWVSPGDLVVDVGAHYGAYTVCLARVVGPAGRVLAVEPASHALDVLRQNVRANGLHSVQVVPAALGDRTDRLILQGHGDPSRASLAGPAVGPDCVHGPDGCGSEVVRVLRLDDLVPAGDRVTFMKIDTEGYELPVLSGSADVLDRDRPVVLFEYQPTAARRAQVPPDGAWDLLARRGYSFHQIGADGEPARLSDPGSLLGQNVLALPPAGPAPAGRAQRTTP
jgi:FkbM family methyltransferase